MSKDRLEAFGEGAALLRGFIGVLPDLNAQDQNILAAGDMVAARFVVEATHQGDLFGIAPAGRRCTAAGSMSAGQGLVGG